MDLARITIMWSFLFALNCWADFSVVVSHPILADMVQSLTPQKIQVTSLIRKGEDPHHFQPTPLTVSKIKKADLVIYNGGGLEPWLEPFIKSIDPNKQLNILAELQKSKHSLIYHPISGELDPHAWMSLTLGIEYIRQISLKLAALDPAHAAEYSQKNQKMGEELKDLQKQFKSQFAKVANKKIITSHQAFQYFGKDMDLDIQSLQGWSAHSDISAKKMRYWIESIKSNKIQALFPESLSSTSLLKKIASESGARLGEPLCADILTTSGPCSSYLGLLKKTADTIQKTLSSQ